MVGGANPGLGPSSGPKILLAKPTSSRTESSVAGAVSGAPAAVVKLMRDRDEENAVRTRLPHGSLSLISESWEIYPDRLLPLMSENTDFTVVGVLGPSGVGKSTILNELYGFDANTPGVLPPFSVLSDETKAMARHCSVGVELRMSAERFILLDTQPLFSASVLTDLMRPDGSSSISVLSGESLSAELAHEMMGIQLGVFLASVCHVLLLVSEGLHDISLWRMILTIEMLKQGIPDPTLVNLSSPGGILRQLPGDKEDEESVQPELAEFFADTIFVHTKLREHECSLYNIKCLKKSLDLYFPSPPFRRNGAIQYVLPQFSSPSSGPSFPNKSGLGAGPLEGYQNGATTFNEGHTVSSDSEDEDSEDEDDSGVNYFILPLRAQDDSAKMQHESYTVMLRKLRDQILSMPRRPFARPISERDWLRNAARVWDFIKKSPVLADYSRTLQNSGLYRR
ncbi:hypothetical protein KP509_35G009400 [Ceratopteris richardii]|uniref:Protein SMG9 n=1 Tax=Ceratopteris richardii TaxID=49495 RepID=A0A8T2QDB7_CERRI|nr:hypothetical protein KP509_35G009400 [Ceratopteris richardii]